ncbi:MAG: tRNA (adenosine(37)-N6)-threonylcarbamoyltransferase complex ATPase subunit type 1 TsaE [Anaerolineales bacterium]|jgi:tRNA threonylcarbamoyladenosine biosynthesis protein TsaE|nr:tRNA (adenosine(37)-N6)-threonylcarbamoyltransferase complex ATPase subunit type 1 TsaE [Anaerolineales bacterium]
MAVIEKGSFEVISRSPTQTRRIGMRLGEMLEPGDVIGLEGNLGAGKTTLVQGIASGWGSYDSVSSPTYVLVNVYRRLDRKQLFHLDAFRLTSPEEAIDLDIDAMLDQGPLLVEWADRIEEALPEEYLWINMRFINDEQRDFIVHARGDRHKNLLERFREEVYGA